MVSNVKLVFPDIVPLLVIAPQSIAPNPETSLVLSLATNALPAIAAPDFAPANTPNSLLVTVLVSNVKLVFPDIVPLLVIAPQSIAPNPETSLVLSLATNALPAIAAPDFAPANTPNSLLVTVLVSNVKLVFPDIVPLLVIAPQSIAPNPETSLVLSLATNALPAIAAPDFAPANTPNSLLVTVLVSNVKLVFPDIVPLLVIAPQSIAPNPETSLVLSLATNALPAIAAPDFAPANTPNSLLVTVLVSNVKLVFPDIVPLLVIAPQSIAPNPETSLVLSLATNALPAIAAPDFAPANTPNSLLVTVLVSNVKLVFPDIVSLTFNY